MNFGLAGALPAAAAAAAAAGQNVILDYFRPHARVSEKASCDFRPPGRAAPVSGAAKLQALAESLVL